MVIVHSDGRRVVTRGRSAPTFEKIEKRWHMVFFEKGSKYKFPIRWPVKYITKVMPGSKA